MCVYEYGLRSTDENPRVGDMVEVYLSQTRKGPKGRPVTKSINEPNRVKTDTSFS